MRDIESLTAPLAVPALHIVASEAPTHSHLGGSPNLPEGVAWPERNGKRLGFLARLSLSEIHQAMRVPWLPEQGALLFFYDLEEQPWGFDPDDRGACRVLHVPDVDRPVSGSDARTEKGDGLIPHQNVVFQQILTRPSEGRISMRKLALSVEEADAITSKRHQLYQDRPTHQIGGYPDPVQGDFMELECQLASHGVYCGDATAHKDHRFKGLATGASDWRLLLAFDTDDDLDVMWGDCGKIFVWARASESRIGNFDNAWLILQSY